MKKYKKNITTNIIKTVRGKAAVNIVKSQKGGIGTIIAVLVTTILVLGLVSYTILGQVAGAKETGDKAQIEQQKINLLIQDSNYVTGNTVRGYISQAIAKNSTLTVTVQSYSGSVLGEAKTYNASSSVTSIEIDDSAIFKMQKTYDADGRLSIIAFTQVDLSR